MSRMARVPSSAQIAVVPPVFSGGISGLAAQTSPITNVPQAGINEPARWQQEGRFADRPLIREISYPQDVQRKSLGGLSSAWANAPVPGSVVLPWQRTQQFKAFPGAQRSGGAPGQPLSSLGLYNSRAAVVQAQLTQNGPALGPWLASQTPATGTAAGN